MIIRPIFSSCIRGFLLSLYTSVDKSLFTGLNSSSWNLHTGEWVRVVSINKSGSDSFLSEHFIEFSSVPGQTSLAKEPMRTPEIGVMCAELPVQSPTKQPKELISGVNGALWESSPSENANCLSGPMIMKALKIGKCTLIFARTPHSSLEGSRPWRTFTFTSEGLRSDLEPPNRTNLLTKTETERIREFPNVCVSPYVCTGILHITQKNWKWIWNIWLVSMTSHPTGLFLRLSTIWKNHPIQLPPILPTMETPGANLPIRWLVLLSLPYWYTVYTP